MYNSIYSLLNNFIYNGTAVADTIQTDVLTWLSTAFSVAILALPFIFLFKLILKVTG